MTISRRGLLYCVPLALAARARAEPAPVQIYAAMTFRPVLERVLTAYRDAGGAAVAVYAPTPVLVRQLAAGAPADILLTADPQWMDAAVAQNLVQPQTRSDLIADDLVLAGPSGSVVVGTITPAFSLEAFLKGGRLALCDPDTHPAGRFAKQSLQSLGYWDTIQAQIAIAESAPAAVVLVDHGEARAAICFSTDLRGDGHALLVGTFPSLSHAPIVYPVALAREPRSSKAAEALAFLQGPSAWHIFSGFGYRMPVPCG
jgi:molybdate transport system substrate-binding protein